MTMLILITAALHAGAPFEDEYLWPVSLKSSHSGRVTREIIEVDYYGLHEITREKPVVLRYTTV